MDLYFMADLALQGFLPGIFLDVLPLCWPLALLIVLLFFKKPVDNE